MSTAHERRHDRKPYSGGSVRRGDRLNPGDPLTRFYPFKTSDGDRLCFVKSVQPGEVLCAHAHGLRSGFVLLGDEGLDWIRGHHVGQAPELLAMFAAQALASR